MKGHKNAVIPALLLLHARELREKQTDAERLMWYLLRGRRLCGQKFRRQYPVSVYVLDFYCYELSLAVELDGGQHLEQKSADAKRDDCLRRQGIKVLRFWNDQVLRDTENVLEEIWLQIKMLVDSPHPGPLPEGEGI